MPPDQRLAGGLTTITIQRRPGETRGQFLILIYKVSAETGSGISDGLKTDETYLCENRVRVGGKKTASDGCSDGSAGLAKKNEVGCCRTRSSNPRGTGPSAVK